MSYAVFSTGGGGPMNDYIFTCERFNVTSTFVAFFGQNRCFMSVRRYFQPNKPKKIHFNFFDRCETLPLNTAWKSKRVV